MSGNLVITPSTVGSMFIGTTDHKTSGTSEGFQFGIGKMCEVIERKSLADAAVRRCPGQWKGTVSAASYANGADWDNVGADVGFLLSFSADGDGVSDEGDVYYGATGPLAGLETPFALNDNIRGDYDGQPDGLVERGEILRNKLASAETSAGNGTGVQLAGAATASQTSILRVVVTAFTGTDITFQVESDTADTWSGAETDVFSSTLDFSAVGHSRTSEKGATTGAWFRLVIGGTFTSCSYIAGFAIEP